VQATHTTLKLKPKKKTIVRGHKLKLLVKVSPKTAGKVTFENGKKVLKKVKVRNGKATLVTKKLKVGKHRLRAVFTPASSSFASSKSKVIKIKVKK
jgi:hypothetical protein